MVKVHQKESAPADEPIEGDEVEERAAENMEQPESESATEDGPVDQE